MKEEVLLFLVQFGSQILTCLWGIFGLVILPYFNAISMDLYVVMYLIYINFV